MSEIRLLVIGCGKMGSAILDGVLSKNVIKKGSLFIVEPNIEQKSYLEKKGFKVFNNLTEVNLSKLKINSMLLAVKPQIAEVVLTNLNKIMINNIFVISIVAGKKISFYKKLLGFNTSIIRAMPNTPASCGKGVTAIYPCKKTNSSSINMAKSLFSSVGIVITLKAESKMDIVTAISGSGPAYVFLFIEELIKSAVNSGLDKKTATVLVTETLLGSSYLASVSNQTPEVLRQNVTSPGGTTEAALKILNKNNSLYKLLNRTVNAAIQRSIKLSS